VKIKRFPLIPRGKGRGWNVALDYLSSALMSCLLAPFYCRGRYDLVFVFETSPFAIGLPALVIKRQQSIPLMFWVLDLWPESLSATGAIRSPTLLEWARRIVRFIYARWTALVSSRGSARVLRQPGVPGEIEYFPIGNRIHGQPKSEAPASRICRRDFGSYLPAMSAPPRISRRFCKLPNI
jgi:hypothetical protein